MTDQGLTVTGTVAGEEAMRDFGTVIAQQLEVGDIVLLHGDLGAGKTTLAQGIAAGLGIEDPVQSPTFTLRAEYAVRLAGGAEVTLHHLDLYRLNEPDELGGIGWDELINADADVMVVEWPERAGDWLPERYMLVSIAYAGAEARTVSVREVSPAT